MDPHVQDFEPRILTRTVETKGSKRTVSRPTSVAKVSYDEDGNEVIKLKIVSREMAQFIIKSRNEKGLKQDELARQSNLDTKTISDIERGGCVYNATQINRIAKVLGVNIPRK
jgi:ribosome-binding protein aMBF1 (putative translation factor)